MFKFPVFNYIDAPIPAGPAATSGHSFSGCFVQGGKEGSADVKISNSTKIKPTNITKKY